MKVFKVTSFHVSLWVVTGNGTFRCAKKRRKEPGETSTSVYFVY